MQRARVILTRPEADSQRFAALLAPHMQGAEVLISPVLRIACTEEIAQIQPEESLILTSGNALDCLPPMPGRGACVVGRATAARARKAGLHVLCEAPCAEALIGEITALAPCPLVHLGGQHLRVDIAARLRDAGLTARRVVVYEQHAQDLSSEALNWLGGDQPVVLPLFSPRSAALVAKQVPPGHAPLWIAGLSAAVTGAFPAHLAAETGIAPSPEAEALAGVVAQMLGRVHRLEGGGASS